MKWLNVIGLLFEFLAFWLAAPELLGEQSLRGIESGLRKFLSFLPRLTLYLIVSAFLIYCFIQARHVTDYFYYSIQILVGSVIYTLIMLFIKKIQRFVDEKISKPLIEKIIHSRETRKKYLLAGAILFTMSFLLQLIYAVIS